MSESLESGAGPSAKPTALVTGGAGFLGSHLCERMRAEGHRVVCVDKRGFRRS